MRVVSKKTVLTEKEVDLSQEIKKIFPAVGTVLSIHQITRGLLELLYDGHGPYMNSDLCFIQSEEQKELAVSLQKFLNKQKDGFQLELVVCWNDEDGHDILFRRQS